MRMRSSGPSTSSAPALHAVRDPPVAVDHHQIGHAGERSVRRSGSCRRRRTAPGRSPARRRAACCAPRRCGRSARARPGAAACPRASRRAPSSGTRAPRGNAGRCAGRTAAAPGGRASRRDRTLLLVEHRRRVNCGAIGRSPGTAVLAPGRRSALAELRLDRRRSCPDPAPGTAPFPRRDSPRRRRRAARRATRRPSALRDAARAVVDHGEVDAVLAPHSVFAFGRLDPTATPTTSKLYSPRSLAIARDRVADRGRSLRPPARRSRRPGACRCASRCRGAGRRASSPRTRAAGAPARASASSPAAAGAAGAAAALPEDPRRCTRARARLRAVTQTRARTRDITRRRVAQALERRSRA